MQLAGPLKSYPLSRYYKILIILSISFFFSNEAFSKSFKTKEDFLNSTLPYFADSLNYIQKAFSVDPKDVRTTKEGYKTGTLTESEHKKILGFAKLALQSSYKVSKKDLSRFCKKLKI